MAKSTIKLPDGTIITIDGDPEEIKRIISIYPGEKTGSLTRKEKHIGGKKSEKSAQDIILEIVSHIKDCEEADVIEEKILDKSSQVDRALLSLYVADNLDSKPLLSSGDIHSVLKELGIKIALPNIINTLRGTAIKYVMPDRRNKKGGGVVQYRISRQGKQYILKVLKG